MVLNEKPYEREIGKGAEKSEEIEEVENISVKPEGQQDYP